MTQATHMVGANYGRRDRRGALDRVRRLGRRDRTELLEQPERVHLAPVLDELAVDDPVDGDPLPLGALCVLVLATLCPIACEYHT